MKTSRIAYEATGIVGRGKVAGTITVSSDLLKSGTVALVREFIKKQHNVEINEGLTVAVLDEAA